MVRRLPGAPPSETTLLPPEPSRTELPPPEPTGTRMVASSGRPPRPGLASGSWLRRGWQQHLGWRGGLGIAMLLAAAAVAWFRGLPAATLPPHTGPTREATAQRLPQGGARQRTEDLGRLLALAQTHGVDVPQARYETMDGPIAPGDPPAASATAPGSGSNVRLQLSLIGPTQGVEAMLRESQSILPHASTEHLGLETVVAPERAAASGAGSVPSRDSIRAQWRILLRYRGEP